MISRSSLPSVGQTRRDSRSGRTYEIDGESYPSVTTILSVIGKPALVQWAAKEERLLCLDTAADLYLDLLNAKPMSRPTYLATLDGRLTKQRAYQRQMQKAADIGTQAHAALEWQIRKALGQVVGPEPRLVDEAMWAFMAGQDWLREHEVKPVWAEQVVYSRTHRYAGTTDLLAYVDGELAVVDFKTSKAIYAEAHLQTTAYRMAVNEMGHGPVANAFIVRLPKTQNDPAFEVQASPAIEELRDAWLHTIGLHRWHAAEDAKRLEAWKAQQQSAEGAA